MVTTDKAHDRSQCLNRYRVAILLWRDKKSLHVQNHTRQKLGYRSRCSVTETWLITVRRTRSELPRRIAERFTDAMDPFPVDNVEDCMEHCSRFWDQERGEPCYGVVFRYREEEDNECYLKTKEVRDPEHEVLETGDDRQSALASLDHLQKLDEACPGTDREFIRFENIGYTIHCNKSYIGFDEPWKGAEGNESLSIPPDQVWEPPFMGFHHANSLEECLSICLAVRPLCRAVAYVPGLTLGYPNCWPKTGSPDLAVFAPDGRRGTIHTAVIDEFDRIDESCPSNTHYEATDNKAFDIHCGQVNTGRNFTSVHAQNITACIDACAVNTDNNCTGIVFDSSLTSGYQNCYLQNTTSIVVDHDKGTYAILAGATVPSSSPPANGGLGDLAGDNNNNSNKNSTSKAWIAGPVIGGLALLGVVGFLLLWWRRRKAHVAGVEVAGSVPKDGYYDGAPAGVGSYNPAQQGRHEMHAHGYAPELEAASEYQPMMVKYAHSAPPYHDEEGGATAVEVPGTVEPQELGGAEGNAERRTAPQELGA